MQAKLADRRVVSDHFRCEFRRDANALLRRQNVEILGIQDELPFPRSGDWLPEVRWVVVANLVEIEERCEVSRLVRDHIGLGVALQVDREPQSRRDVRSDEHIVLDVDQRLLLVQLDELGIGWRLDAANEAQLVQPGTLAHEDAEGAGHDFDVELSLVTGGDTLELAAEIRD